MEKISRLEFGNPSHIKLAEEGYILGKAIESGLEAKINYSNSECDQCGGTGEFEIYECTNCGFSTDSPLELVYRADEIRQRRLPYELLDRCRRCKALLIHYE